MDQNQRASRRAQDRQPLLRHVAALVLTGTALGFTGAGLHAAPATAAPGMASPAAPAAAQTAADCGCVSPYREYTREPTPEVIALFKAARNADEAAFTRALAAVSEPQEYAVDGEPLLAALLRPVDGLVATQPSERRKVWWDYTPAEARAIRERHRATLPAKTRMLALAIQRGASVKDMSYQMRQPPLHLAALFGTPEMVDQLLAAGADANQREWDRNLNPVEFMLDHEFYTRMTYLPELVDAEDRGRMLLALFKAGAERPFKRVDERLAQEARAQGEAPQRPAADDLAWPMIAQTTRGAEVMEALARTGTAPVFEADNLGLSPLGFAARAGNVGGVRWLKAHAPRTLRVEDAARGAPFDVWLGAATWALYPATTDAQALAARDLILDELLRPGMPWAQANPVEDESDDPLVRRREVPAPAGGATLMHHVAALGDVALAERLLKLGAPIDGAGGPGDETTPLGTAVMAGQRPMVEWLLRHGADPLGGPTPESTPFHLALAGDEQERYLDDAERAASAARRGQALPALLGQLTPQQRQRLESGEPSPLVLALRGARGAAGAASLKRVLAAGFSARTFDASVLEIVVDEDDMPLLVALLDGGLRIDTARARSLQQGERAAATIDVRLFVAALHGSLRGEGAGLIERLLRVGADPNQADAGGMNAVNFALLRGDEAQLEQLLAAGGRLEAGRCRSLDDPPTALDWAALSGSEAKTLRVMQATGTTLSDSCWPQPDALITRAMLDDDAYWSFLTAHGFGAQNADYRGPSMAERLVRQMFENPQLPAVAWAAPRVSQRLQTLWQLAQGQQRVDADLGRRLMQAAQSAERADIVAVLSAAQVASVPAAAAAPPKAQAAAPKPTAAERALAKRLVGHYYLVNQREVGAELLLEADGRFDFALAYGATDQTSRGRWTVDKQRVVFTTETRQPPAGWKPFALRAGTPAQGTPDTFAVRVLAEGRPIPGVRVTLFGCAAPRLAEGETDQAGFWEWPVSFPVCQAVLYHPRADRGRIYVYANTDPARTAFDFDYVPSAHLELSDFNVQMSVTKEGALLWDRDGRALRFSKE